jgi:hypothetical protein
MRTHIFNRMTAGEIEKYLADGKDAIFVAIGSTGAHGSMPVDAEAVLADGLATALAEKAGAVALVGLPFFYPGEAVISSGTVYTSLRDGYEYLWKILISLKRQGFRKLFLVPSHENITIMLRALTRDFFEATHLHPIVVDLKSVLTGAKKHDSTNMFKAGDNTRQNYIMEMQKRLHDALPDAAAYERLICGAYSIMGKKDELIVDPDLENVEATDLDPAVAGFVKRAGRFRGTVAELRDDPHRIAGGCVFRSEEERDRVCEENEKKLRAAVDYLDLEHLLKVVGDYQVYSLKVCEKFPRFNRLAEDR